MKHNFHATDRTVGGIIVLEYDDEPYKGIQWTFGGMTFADEENPDGSLNMSYDFEVVSEHNLSEEQLSEFGKITGDVILQILQEQIEKKEVVYKGGVNETTANSD